MRKCGFFKRKYLFNRERNGDAKSHNDDQGKDEHLAGPGGIDRGPQTLDAEGKPGEAEKYGHDEETDSGVMIEGK